MAKSHWAAMIVTDRKFCPIAVQAFQTTVHWFFPRCVYSTDSTEQKHKMFGLVGVPSRVMFKYPPKPKLATTAVTSVAASRTLDAAAAMALEVK